jgi:hypothetical protein
MDEEDLAAIYANLGLEHCNVKVKLISTRSTHHERLLIEIAVGEETAQ